MATRGEIGDQNVGTGVFQYGECDCMRRKVENEADCGDICVCAHQFILSKNDPLWHWQLEDREIRNTRMSKKEDEPKQQALDAGDLKLLTTYGAFRCPPS